jgi:hypothetical protein
VHLQEEGRKIINHFNKLEEYYNDWQDRLYRIELKIQEAEKETGLDVEEIAEYDALADALTDLGESDDAA